jgi:hypothetical protein
MAMTSLPEDDDQPHAEEGVREGRWRASNVERRPGSGPRAIGELAVKLVAKPLGKRGIAAAALAADWAAIVGPALADSTLPLRIAYPRGERNQGTLHLKVSSGAMALQLQHLGPLIVERVNTHFGYRAVAKLAFTQGPMPARSTAAQRKRDARELPTAPLDPALAGRIETLPDEDLRTALGRLGRRLAPGWHRP